jgi:hypothetical protein
MIYEYMCETCGRREEAVRTVAQMLDGPVCCLAVMTKKIFTPGMRPFVASEESYQCVATGQKVTSSRQRRYILDKHELADVREFGDHDPAELARESAQMEDMKVNGVPQEVPAELKEAMIRENLGDLL